MLGGCISDEFDNDTKTTELTEDEAVPNTTKKSGLTEKWATPNSLKTPESIFYDKRRNSLYVSNINGQPADIDSNGFISKVALSGKINTLKWVVGLNAPKGMGVYKNRLYVTDITDLVVIDIDSGTIIERHHVSGASFLNDIAITKKGTVYISGMASNTIYRFQDSIVTAWLSDEKLNNPNGLIVEAGELLVGSKNALLSIDLSDKSFMPFIKNTGGIDGLKEVGKGFFIITDWSGIAYFIHPDFPRKKILDTTPNRINAADIEYISSKKLLFIPTFFDNRVVAYDVEVK